MGLFGHYITDNGKHELKNYKYYASGVTPCDKLLSYWWEFAVCFVPLWVAPNILTLLGFFCANGAFILAVVYSPSLTEVAPSWVYYSIVLLLFLYQTLDAIDGKQARRTQTSSPLGQLFDHGCDIMITTSVALAALAVTCAGTGLLQYAVIVVSTQVQQFIYMWWEYHFHVFYSATGVIGVTEAQLGVRNQMLCTIISKETYMTPTLTGIRVMALCLISAVFGPTVTHFDLLYYVPSFIKDRSSSFHLVPSSFTLLDAFIVCLFSLNLIIAVYDICAGLIMVQQKVLAAGQIGSLGVFIYLQWILFKSCLLERLYVPPLLVYFTMSTAYSILVIRLCISTTCRMPYSFFQWPIVPFAVICIILGYSFEDYMSVGALLLVVLIWNAVYLADLLITSVNDLCRFLNVSCFKVSTKPIQKES